MEVLPEQEHGRARTAHTVFRTKRVCKTQARCVQRPGAEQMPDVATCDGRLVLQERVWALCALDGAYGRLEGGLSHGKARSNPSDWEAPAIIPARTGQRLPGGMDRTW